MILIAENIELLTQIKFLESKVEYLSNANERYLTITWSVIAFFATISVFFIGYNIISNVYTNKRELEKIRTDLFEDLGKELERKFAIQSVENIRILREGLEENRVMSSEGIRNTHYEMLMIKYFLYKREFYSDLRFGDETVLGRHLERLEVCDEIERHLNLEHSVYVSEALDTLFYWLRPAKVTVENRQSIERVISKINDSHAIRKEQVLSAIRVIGA